MSAMERSLPQIHVDDESVEVFLPESETRQIVIVTLDEQGRPTTFASWDPKQACLRDKPTLVDRRGHVFSLRGR
jgi:hypothetical protein